MRLSFLHYLSCPSPGEADALCRGRLEESSRNIPERRAVGDADELLEGEVVCQRCGAVFPVLGGVLILVANPDRYLGRRYRSMMPFVALHADLSPAALGWIEEKNFLLYETKPQRDAPDSTAVLHYERPARLLEGVEIPESFRTFLEDWDGKGPYDLLAGMADRGGGPEKRLAVDAGCGVGGLVQRLSDSYDAVLGIDMSFTSVLVARSILLHQPQAYRHRIHVARDLLRDGLLQRAKRSNVEIVVADCTVLPFDDETVDSVASANVLEIVTPRALLTEAVRVLRPDGLFLLTDPFKFRLGSSPSLTGSHLEDARAGLRERGLTPVEELDWVPWIWYRYQRNVQIFFNYCGSWSRAATRPEMAEQT